MMKRFTIYSALAFAAFVSTADVRADEGMWLFTNPPTRQIEEKYGAKLDAAFLEHLQKSSIRFGAGGSASFVSSNGLIMTNHHVALSSLSDLSTKEKNYALNGFKAERYEDEIKCPKAKLIVLQEIVDVTEEIEAAVADAKTADEAQVARKAKIAKIEADAKTEKKLRCEVVTLYQGGLYHLYCYKELNDIRLVFAPEKSVGFFGGDPDNFEYPRYNLDVSFFRAYENDKPYRPEHFLTWSENGPADGELVLVSGHPARTNRFNTVADLQFQRDVYYPYTMSKYRRREVAYQTFGSRNDENARRVATYLFGIQNSRKNRGGILNGLQTPELMNAKIAAENELRKLVVEKSILDLSENDPWRDVENAMNGWRDYYVAYDLLENGEAFYCATVKRAREIVRFVSESAKPEAKRLPAYRDAATLERLRNELTGELNADPADVETLKLADSLAMLFERSQPVATGRAVGSCVVPQAEFDAIFNGVSPKSRANEIVLKTKLRDEEFRKTLLASDWETLQKSDDPAIRLALAVEPTARALRDRYETTVAEPSRQAYAKIAKARFAVYGTEVYPDATFTLRLSFGKVAGYTEDDGTAVPFQTTIGGAYEHAREHNSAYPFDLAKSWFDAESVAPLDSPINVVTTNDIIGGNSGSPAVNAKGEVVGLIFDGNIPSLVSNFTYEDVQSRAVLVHSNGIRDAARYIYQLPKLADELGK